MTFQAHHRPSSARHRAFSLIEILVAVGILSIMIIGLLAMFYQTQRALRRGTTQVDVLESGRAAMQLITSELEQLGAAGHTNVMNIVAGTNLTGVPTLHLHMPRAGNPADVQVNILQHLFFLTRKNDRWVGIGYFVQSPLLQGNVATLHRFETNKPLSEAWQIFPEFLAAIQNFNTDPTRVDRVIDRVVHLRVRPYDAFGTNTFFGDFSYPTNNLMMPPLPAYLDVELGVLEPRTYEKYRALTDDPANARTFLEKQVDKVHLFRQRIPIRTANEQ